MEFVNNKSANFLESEVVYFDINGPLNHSEMVPVAGMEGMSSAHHPYPRN